MTKTNSTAAAPTKAAGFDLGDYVAQTTIFETVLLPNGEPMLGTDGEPVVAELCSVDDERYLKVQRRVIDERTARMRGRRGNKGVTAVELDAEQSKLVAGAVVGLSNNLAWDGKPFSYSPENAVRLLSTLRFVREQFDQVINDRERFFAKTSTT